jgi:hypothetical protein
MNGVGTAVVLSDRERTIRDVGGYPVAHELPQLQHDHPACHVWASAKGHLYATRPGISVSLPGASVTVDAETAEGLSHAIAAAERDADSAAHLRERLGHGRP